MPAAHLEVWGSPIGHSRSPQLHLAAYRALGLDWGFSRREVSPDRFDAMLASSSARGLAVTHPLKERAFRATGERDRRALLTRVANTLLLRGPDGGAPDGGPRAFNTDVGGIVRALREERGDAPVDRVRIVGSGATATSALVAAAEMGASRIEIAARRPERAAALAGLAPDLGADVRVAALPDAADEVDLTIATLPGGTALPDETADRLGAIGGALFDVAYSPWPSPLATRWPGAAGHGLGMLLHQAVLQVRIFVGGDPDLPLPDEPAIVDAMRRAVA
ncbi:shikimate dehydrogenase family protein [Microbacterium sp. gxy059]|uniref:shikimate dehydrogenase family protein n=1 Tax=Microbacterium sp. gxy059 TaxID=2957199 RepID=UPI003D98F0EC